MEPALAHSPAAGSPDRVLVAHPQPLTVRAISRALSHEYAVTEVADGRRALDILRRHRLDAALVSVDLPGLSGLEVLRRLPRQRGAGVRPLTLAFGAAGDPRLEIVRTHELADAVVDLPCSQGALLTRFWRLMDEEVERSWQGLNPVQQNLIAVTRRTIETVTQACANGLRVEPEAVRDCSRILAAAARSDDLVAVLDSLRSYHNSTYVHSLRVASSMTVFGIATGMGDSDVELLAQAGLLHDIGKNVIPLEILNKPGRLHDSEWDVMRRHPVVGGETLRRNGDVSPLIIQVVENHHERLDGSGYPRGLKGAEIDDPSLVCAIADVHSALTEKRAYKAPLSNEQAMAVMQESTGTHFEPAFLAKFRTILLDGRVV